MKYAQLAPVNKNNPKVQSVVVTEDKFDENGIATSGTKRMRIPVLREKADQALEKIRQNLDDYQFGEDLGAGWFEPLILTNQDNVRTHAEQEIEEEA